VFIEQKSPDIIVEKWKAVSSQNRAKAILRSTALVFILVGFFSIVRLAYGQVLSPDDVLDKLTAKDLTDSLIALVNFNTTPGISGTRLNVDTGDGNPDLRYDKVSFYIPMSWSTTNPKLKIRSQIAFGTLQVEDSFFAKNTQGQTIRFDAEREIYSGRIGLGVDYYPAPKWRIIPYIAFAPSKLKSQTQVQGGSLNLGNLTPVEQALVTDWETNAWTLAAVLETRYDHWFGQEDYRIELKANYVHAYSETFDESLPLLEASGHTDTVTFLARWTTITDFISFGRPLAWNLYTNYTSFLNQEKDTLGFNYYFEFGGGIDWYIKKKFFHDSFKISFVGLRAGVVVGENVTGGTIGFAFRYR
jgi:hypothetical protein